MATRVSIDAPAPVFGPERPGAAYKAITELDQARDAYTGSDASRARLRRAEAIRAQYAEYGDAAAALDRARG